MAQVDVQNRLKRIEARLPQAVVQQGVTITRARSNLLMFVNLISTTGEQSPVALGDYLARNIINEIKRIPGVGVAQLFALVVIDDVAGHMGVEEIAGHCAYSGCRPSSFTSLPQASYCDVT